MNDKKKNQAQANKLDNIEERVVEIKRVSKKTKGGNTIHFAALVVAGDKNGKVGSGYGKGRDVSTAINKGISQARKKLTEISLKENTIAHEVADKLGSAQVLLKPAPKGAGIIAGGTVRTVIELAGIKDISAKMLGSSNKILNIRSTIRALKKLKV